MWELNISIDKDNSECLSVLEKRIAGKLKETGGVVLREDCSARSSLSIACEDDRSPAVIDELTDSIADIIINNFKLKYLLKRSRLPKSNKINYNAFIKALVAFDREWDREIVLNKLFYSGELLLDGFFNFRLKELKSRWQEVVDLANENAGYLEYHETFIELLKFLIRTIDSLCDEVTVIKADGLYFLKAPGGGDLPRDKYGLEPHIKDDTIIPALIQLSPEKITLYPAGIPEHIVSLLKELFEGKVIVKGKLS